MITDNKRKISLSYIYAAAVTALLLLLAAWHFLDIKAAVAECGDGFLAVNYLLLTAYLAAVCGLAWYLIRVKKAAYHVTAGILIMLLGGANIFVFKGLSAPDEVSHYISAYKLSNELLHMPVTDEYGQVYVRACDLYLEDTKGRMDEVRAANEAGIEDFDRNLVIFGQTLDEEVYRVYHDGLPESRQDAGGTALSCQWTVGTTPAAYIPQALGISLARIIGLGPLGLISLGKLFNLMFFALMTSCAVYIIPKGRDIMCSAALLPMMLHLAGSMSYDVFAAACSFMFIALIINIRDEGGSLKKYIAAALVLALLAPCKLVYSLLIMLILMLICTGDRKKRREYMIFGICCLLLAGISMYAVNSAVISGYASAEETVIEWAEEAEGYTLSYLLHRPVELIGIFYRSFMMMSGNWFATMFGIYLGNQDPVLNVPYPLIGLLAAGLMLIAAGSDIRLGARGRCVAAAVSLAVLAALMGSMLIAYTPMSSPYIQGVQGRYLLPVLPLILMCIPGDYISVRKSASGIVLWTFITAESFVLIRVFATVALRIG